MQWHSMIPHALREFLWVGGFMLVLPCTAGAAGPEGPEDQVVVLPPLVVKADSMEFDGWCKTVSPHFVLYTDYSADEAQVILRRLEVLRTALDRLSGLPSFPTRPIAFIFPSRRSDWDKLENFDQNIKWASRAVTWGADENITVLQVIREGALLAQLLVREDPHFGFNVALGGDFCSAHNLPELFWFKVGVSLLAAYADVREDGVVFGRHTIRDFAYSRSSALPWERFFAVTGSYPENLGQRSMGVLYAQFSLSVRYLLANHDPARRSELYTWLRYIGEGNPPTEARFKEIFGLDWAAWTQIMSFNQGLRFGAAAEPGLSIRVFPAECAPPIRRVDLRPVEMRELFILSRIFGGAAKHSADLLNHLLAKGVKTSDLRPLLASACISEKRTEPALRILRILSAEGGANPRIYEEAARLIFERAVPQIGLDSRMGTETEEVRTLCRRAIALNPYSLAGNDILAWSLALSPRVGPEGIDALRQLIARQDAVDRSREIRGALALAAYRSGDAALAGQTSRDLLSGPVRDDRAAAVSRQILAVLSPTVDLRQEIKGGVGCEGQIATLRGE
jgi:hypothetical protein